MSKELDMLASAMLIAQKLHILPIHISKNMFNFLN